VADNLIDNFDQLEFVSMASEGHMLRALSLEGNPIARLPNYRSHTPIPNHAISVQSLGCHCRLHDVLEECERVTMQMALREESRLHLDMHIAKIGRYRRGHGQQHGGKGSCYLIYNIVAK